MAGDWMKVECDTPDKPEVLAIAAALDIDPDDAFGKCFRCWRWFDKHTESGNARSVSKALLDRQLGVSGLCDAMESVGWLIVSGDGISLPNFDRHNGQTAKRRGLTAKRVAKHEQKTNAKPNALSVSAALPREEKRREEKEVPPISPPRGDVSADGRDAEKRRDQAASDRAFDDFWAIVPRKEGKSAAKRAYLRAVKRVASDADCKPAEARRHIYEAMVAFADSPKGQGDFCPHPSTWLNEGRYDDDRSAWSRQASPPRAEVTLPQLTDDE